MSEEGPNTKGAPLLVAAHMREIEAQVRVCRLCKLSRTRTNAVPGEGDYRAEIMFIGEGPGYHEDKQGRPFVGNAGDFLNELLEIAGLSRPMVFITNVVKCRPPNNRDPEPDEIGACSGYLGRQIALINPRIIVTLGRFSMARFFPGERISQIHGMARVIDGRMCVAMYHPAAGLHQASLADIIRSDFRKLPLFIEQARKMLAPAVQPEDDGRPAVDDGEVQALVTDAPLQTSENTQAEVLLQAPAKPPEAAQKKRGKREKSEGDYKQLNFFDL
jgi:uracil-DNA glycosylase family 4